MSDDLIKMEREQHDGLVILRLGGEIDLANVKAAGQPRARDRRLRRTSCRLAAIEYIDSQGLRLL